jgi:hypothetical protein
MSNAIQYFPLKQFHTFQLDSTYTQITDMFNSAKQNGMYVAWHMVSIIPVFHCKQRKVFFWTSLELYQSIHRLKTKNNIPINMQDMRFKARVLIISPFIN